MGCFIEFFYYVKKKKKKILLRFKNTFLVCLWPLGEEGKNWTRPRKAKQDLFATYFLTTRKVITSNLNPSLDSSIGRASAWYPGGRGFKNPEKERIFPNKYEFDWWLKRRPFWFFYHSIYVQKSALVNFSKCCSCCCKVVLVTVASVWNTEKLVR